MFNLSPEQVTEYRAKLLAGSDSNLVADVGFFMIWYSTVDLAFTNLLSVAARATDLDIFDSLCGSMDLRDKIRRFRRIRRLRGGVGPDLDCRLTYLDQKCRPIRNRLAHCSLSLSEAQKGNYLASTLGSMPWDDFGEVKPKGQKMSPPVIYTPAQLVGWGVWLSKFATDLSIAHDNALKNGEFEIILPRTPAPPVDQGTPAPPAHPSNDDRPAQNQSE